MSVWTRRTHERNAPIAHVLDLLSRIAFGEVDGYATNVLGLLKTLCDTVDNINSRRAAQFSRVRSHQTNGASTKDGDRFARFKA